MSRLDPAQLYMFFEDLEDWCQAVQQPSSSLPPPPADLAIDVARYHIIPKLGDGRAANRNSAAAGRVFQDCVDNYIYHSEPVNSNQTSDPEQRRLHQTHRDQVVSVILGVLFSRDCNFALHRDKERPEAAAVLYFARRCDGPVDELIGCSNTGQGHRPSDPIVTPFDGPITGTTIEPQSKAAWSRPESALDRLLYETAVRTALQHRKDNNYWRRWLALYLLRREGGYEYAEIIMAQQQSLDLRADGLSWSEVKVRPRHQSGWSTTMPVSVTTRSWWACGTEAGNNAPKQPVHHPGEVWEIIRSGYSLPPWFPETETGDGVCCWFPPPPMNEEAMRAFYLRGSRKLRRQYL